MQILNFSSWSRPKADWSNQQMAEFYRVESALIQAGIPIEIDRGLTDEGDPWLVFAHSDTGDVIVHFARADHQYIAAIPQASWVIRGADFRVLITEFMRTHPVLLPVKEESRKSNVLLHPSALFTAFVATAFYMDGFRVSDVQAAERKPAEVHTPTRAANDDVVAAAPPADADRDNLTRAVLLAAVAFAVEIRHETSALLAPEAQPDTLNVQDALSGKQPQFAARDVIASESDAWVQASRQLHAAADLSEPHGADNQVARQPEEVSAIDPRLTRPPASPTAADFSSDPTSTQHMRPDVAQTPLGDEPRANHSDLGKETATTWLGHSRALPAPGDADQADHSTFSTPPVLAYILENATPILVADLRDERVMQLVRDVEHNIASLVEAHHSETDEVRETAIIASPTMDVQTSVRSNLAKDEGVDLKLIGAFLKSDTDIKTIVDDSVIVIYDQSDLASSTTALEFHNWQISDTMFISIVGSAAFFEQYQALHA